MNTIPVFCSLMAVIGLIIALLSEAMHNRIVRREIGRPTGWCILGPEKPIGTGRTGLFTMEIYKPEGYGYRWLEFWSHGLSAGLALFGLGLLMVLMALWPVIDFRVQHLAAVGRSFDLVCLRLSQALVIALGAGSLAWALVRLYRRFTWRLIGLIFPRSSR